MNWTEIIVGALVGAFVVTIFWGIQQMREIFRDTNYSRGLRDGLRIADPLMEIAKLLEKEYRLKVVDPTINEDGEAK